MTVPEKEYKPTEELEIKEGYVKDPVSGKLVKITPERVEAKIVFAQRLLYEIYTQHGALSQKKFFVFFFPSRSFMFYETSKFFISMD